MYCEELHITVCVCVCVQGGENGEGEKICGDWRWMCFGVHCVCKGENAELVC